MISRSTHSSTLTELGLVTCDIIAHKAWDTLRDKISHDVYRRHVKRNSTERAISLGITGDIARLQATSGDVVPLCETSLDISDDNAAFMSVATSGDVVPLQETSRDISGDIAAFMSIATSGDVVPLRETLPDTRHVSQDICLLVYPLL